jgi:uncharacterized membrane protein
MKEASRSLVGPERLIAGLLWYGTWIAVAVTGASFVIEVSGHDGLIVAKAGIVLFILLPVARVVLMLVIFVRARDHIYAVISALVLAVIATGFVVGMGL